MIPDSPEPTPPVASPVPGAAAAATPGDPTAPQAGGVPFQLGAESDPASLSTSELIGLLQQDRQWLLRQIDAGRWPEWRLDLAALERELGLLLEQAADHSLAA